MNEEISREPWPVLVPGPVPDYPADFKADLVRPAVRIVLLDRDGKVLLIRAEAPAEATPVWWDLPGGGVDPGETYVETAVRELFEETGLRIAPADVGPPMWRRSVTWIRYGERRVQHELVVRVTIGDSAPDLVDRSGWEPKELEEYTALRWWTVEEICAGDARFYPGTLPLHLPRFLAGERIDEPFEHWN
jgi:8-oxo-dGTP pyrophosphatase MutT (NUDIX family)